MKIIKLLFLTTLMSMFLATPIGAFAASHDGWDWWCEAGQSPVDTCDACGPPVQAGYPMSKSCQDRGGKIAYICKCY